MKEFKVCCIQFAVKPLDADANITKCIDWLDRAVAEHSPDLVVFPETITTGFHPGMPKEEFWKLLQPIPGAWTEAIQARAAHHGVHVVWPIWEQGTGGVIFNASILIGDVGNIIGVYRKTHPFPTEQIYTTPGTEVEVFDTPFAKIGMVICYDGDFPELVRTLALKGADVVIRPSALLRDFDIWSLTNRARAYDNQIHFIAVNSVGADANGNYYFGHSMVVDPCARVIAQARGGEQMITATISPETVKESLVFHLNDRNTAVYDLA